MLLQSYRLDIFNSECNPGAMTEMCHAHLDQDVGDVLPFLNAWEHRYDIEPSHEGLPRPKVIHILKLLPKTNCRECGEPTCMVFAARAAEGAKGADDCPALEAGSKKKLSDYLSGFRLA